MPNFSTFAPKNTLIRKFGKIGSISDYVTAIDAFKNKEFSLLSSYEQSNDDFYEEKNIIKNDVVYTTVGVFCGRKGEIPNESAYSTFNLMFNNVNNAKAEDLIDIVGATAVADSDSIKLKASFKVKLTNGDTATITFTEKSITMSGYLLDASGTAFTTWADTKAVFSTDP